MLKKYAVKNDRLMARVAALLMAALCLAWPLPVNAAGEGETFHYIHDPMENPKAAEDIVVNENAVYGFSPSPDSVRLKEFVDAIDWTDPAQVAGAREERAQYHAKNAELYQMIADMGAEGKSLEETARAVSRRRNELRLESYANDPDGLARVKQSNLDTYGNEEGPTADSLYEKYGSWQIVLEKALSTNAGMDACLGFYDEYYFTYDIAGKDAVVAAADETVQENPTSDKVYTVEKGDCLWKISVKFFKVGSKWREIFEQNMDVIKDPALISPGQTLKIPEKAETAS